MTTLREALIYTQKHEGYYVVYNNWNYEGYNNVQHYWHKGKLHWDYGGSVGGEMDGLDDPRIQASLDMDGFNVYVFSNMESSKVEDFRYPEHTLNKQALIDLTKHHTDLDKYGVKNMWIPTSFVYPPEDEYVMIRGNLRMPDDSLFWDRPENVGYLTDHGWHIKYDDGSWEVCDYEVIEWKPILK